MRKFYFTILIASILVSCKTNQLYLNVIEPAPVTIPSYVKKVGIIDRSKPTDDTRPIDVAEKVISLESATLDREGAMQSISGLSEELISNNRFEEVKTLKEIDFRTPQLLTFPTALTWDIVEKICNETGTDALFSLEKFDTDTHVQYSSKKVEMKTILGTIPAIEHQAEMQTIVKTGWRIYDPSGLAILDEYTYEESINSSGKGINPILAAAALLGRKEAVGEVSNKAGHGYGIRIVPYQIRVLRDYYVKGTNNFKIAKRKAQVGKWDEAGKLWEKETSNRDMKIAGRATYNMAIINEINGDLDAALGWAQKAYEDYNIKPALEYVRILENRKVKSDIVAEQEER